MNKSCAFIGLGGTTSENNGRLIARIGPQKKSSRSTHALNQKWRMPFVSSAHCRRRALSPRMFDHHWARLSWNPLLNIATHHKNRSAATGRNSFQCLCTRPPKCRARSVGSELALDSPWSFFCDRPTSRQARTEARCVRQQSHVKRLCSNERTTCFQHRDSLQRLRDPRRTVGISTSGLEVAPMCASTVGLASSCMVVGRCGDR